MNKKEKEFREEFVKFLKSKKESKNYTELFVAVRYATMFGDGLMFDRVEEIVKEELEKYKKVRDFIEQKKKENLVDGENPDITTLLKSKNGKKNGWV